MGDHVVNLSRPARLPELIQCLKMLKVSGIRASGNL